MPLANQAEALPFTPPAPKVDPRRMFATSDDDHRYCIRCGAAVVDVPAHRAFHEQLDAITTALAG